VENTLVQAELKNNYAYGNVVVKFCYIFTCPVIFMDRCSKIVLLLLRLLLPV
jgi:hypothetical protein